ncbi:hypothetical protein RHGRI_026284 [Rhododendron griersonianum]|uniref:Uncharacterized protein n=1 Tax=Rhododendron griersonianum TaxID=479676 RepID=A0AAV6IXN3_9ERIC|nr:hypothetical protein RHGRI_026284 [Rhododendron griersonianum]
MASPGELNRMVVREEAKKKHKRRREKKKKNLINEEEEEDKQPESDAPNSEGEQKESIELKKKKKKMKKLEREVEDADEEREEEGSKSEEKKRKVKVNSGFGIMTTERFESLPISELSLNSIKEMNFQCLTQVTKLKDPRFVCSFSQLKFPNLMVHTLLPKHLHKVYAKQKHKQWKIEVVKSQQQEII